MQELQCWAYGPNGRCEHPAGHPGNHIIETTWTDAECVVPTLGHPQHAPAVADVAPAPVQVPVQEDPEPCVACNHMHKSAACKCGCYAHI